LIDIVNSVSFFYIFLNDIFNVKKVK
jgi:hypothetical protein